MTCGTWFQGTGLIPPTSPTSLPPGWETTAPRLGPSAKGHRTHRSVQKGRPLACLIRQLAGLSGGGRRDFNCGDGWGPGLWGRLTARGRGRRPRTGRQPAGTRPRVDGCQEGSGGMAASRQGPWCEAPGPSALKGATGPISTWRTCS